MILEPLSSSETVLDIWRTFTPLELITNYTNEDCATLNVQT